MLYVLYIITYYIVTYIMYIHISTTVISEPDDVIICEGEGAVFTCVLNSNIRSDDVQWYRFIKDTSTTVMVDPNGENFNIMNHSNGSTTSSSLTITNAIKSYTGYFWVGTPSLNVCNASLTVGTSTYCNIGEQRFWLHNTPYVCSYNIKLLVQKKIFTRAG